MATSTSTLLSPADNLPLPRSSPIPSQGKGAGKDVEGGRTCSSNNVGTPKEKQAQHPHQHQQGAVAGHGECGGGVTAVGTSMRPSSSGIIARSFSGNFSQQQEREREERAASLADRYKGTGIFRQQRQCGGSNTGSRVLSTSSGTSSGTSTRGEEQQQQGGRSGGHFPTYHHQDHPSGSAAATTDPSRRRRRTATAASSTRRYIAPSSRRGWDADADADAGAGAGADAADGRSGAGVGGVDGEGGQEQEEQQGNGRVAQIAESLLWVQKHPVLAAVIWMCGKVLDPGSDTAQQEEEGTSAARRATTTGEGGSPPGRHASRRRGDGSDGSGRAGPTRSGFGGSGEQYADYAEAEAEDGSDPGLWGGSSGEFEKGRVVPPGFWKRHSKGRLSWSDDYQGGCLAEYYEDERTRMASGSSSVPPSEPPSEFDTDMTGTAPPTASASSASAPGAHAFAASTKPQAYAGDATAAATVGGAATAGVIAGTEGPGGRVDASGLPSGSSAEDDDGEVFHSALQLQPVDDLEGVGVGGCATMVHRDTFYGDMRDAMQDQQKQMQHHERSTDAGSCSAKPETRGTTGDAMAAKTSTGAGADGHECGGFYPHAASVGVGTGTEAEAGAGAAVAETEVNGAGTPNAAGPGTWSPQWGWYVTMTPPQDQYPAEQNPMSVAKAGTSATATPAGSVERPDDAATAPTSVKGRPPRP